MRDEVCDLRVFVVVWFQVVGYGDFARTLQMRLYSGELRGELHRGEHIAAPLQFGKLRYAILVMDGWTLVELRHPCARAEQIKVHTSSERFTFRALSRTLICVSH